MSSRLGTSSSQISFTAWLRLGTSKPSTSSSLLRLLHSSRRAALDKTQVGADLGLYYLGNPRSSLPSGHLQTTLEHCHFAPAQLVLHGGWRLVAGCHNQSLQVTGLGKSLPLTCQQQPRSKYKRWVYSAHIKGAPWIPSLGDRGGCATGPYRTPTTLGHTTKTRSQSTST